MVYIEWNNVLSVGVSQFDNEHKRIIEYINELNNSFDIGADVATVGNILGGLVDYTMTHFSHEEELMRTYGYPDCDSHKAEHDELFVKVNEFRLRFKMRKIKYPMNCWHFSKIGLLIIFRVVISNINHFSMEKALYNRIVYGRNRIESKVHHYTAYEGLSECRNSGIHSGRVHVSTTENRYRLMLFD